MRNNTLVMLGASAAFGILAVVLARGWISNALEAEFSQSMPASLSAASLKTPAAANTTPVLVAAHDLAFGDTLSPESFQLVDYPEASVPLDTYMSTQELFDTLEPGRPLRALADIRALEPVFSDRISGPGAKAALSTRIRPGYVATGVAVDPVTGVGGHVVPGDLVDVMHITQPDPDDRPELFQTTILLQTVRVLGIDQNAVQSTEDPAVARTVTLEVDRMDLQVLALGTETGTLALALRGAGETDFVTAASLQSDQIGRATHATAKPVPTQSSRTAPVRTARVAKPKDDGRTRITVHRGDEVQSVRVRRDAPVQSADASDALLAGGR